MPEMSQNDCFFFEMHLGPLVKFELMENVFAAVLPLFAFPYAEAIVSAWCQKNTKTSENDEK